jgi:hypothetical protein
VGREIRRVPVDFDWPRGETWHGYLMPEHLGQEPCPDCTNGYSRHATNLFNRWYGRTPFRPEDNGSTPFQASHPGIRAKAERNVAEAPHYYGTGESAIQREASRLAALYNGAWSHHLNAADVAALLEADRLYDFTHQIIPGKGWQRREPLVIPTPEEVNNWSIQWIGHDSINASVVVRARCELEGFPAVCGTCNGSGGIWRDAEHKAAHEAWERTDPPTGDGWQLWETVSEGSPISPVFPTADGLTEWMTTEDAKWGAAGPWSREQAAAFVNGPGVASSLVYMPEVGLVDGVTAVTKMATTAATTEGTQP